jgi:hypothetical protein
MKKATVPKLIKNPMPVVIDKFFAVFDGIVGCSQQTASDLPLDYEKLQTIVFMFEERGLLLRPLHRGETQFTMNKRAQAILKGRRYYSSYENL